MTPNNQDPNEISELQLAIFIILMVVISGLCMALYTQHNDKEASFGNLTIKGSQLDSIIDAVPDGKFKICHIDTNECVVLVKEKME